MQLKKQHALLFSDTADTETTSLIRRIPGRHDRFATDFVGVEGHVAVRLEAWQGESGLWAIDRLTYVPALDRVDKTLEARPGLCFFDALYHCAKFQTTELAGHEGRQVVGVPEYDTSGIVSYREAAEAAHQLIGEDGLAKPCAQGRVLISGSFSPAALSAAARTRTEALLPARREREPSFPLLLNTLADAPMPATDPDSDIARYGARRRQKDNVAGQVAALEQASIAALALQNCMTGQVRNEFRAEHPVANGILTLGMAPLIGYALGEKAYKPGRRFLRAKLDFEKVARGLPGPREKSLVAAFAKAADSAFWLERAAWLMKKNEAGQYSESAVCAALAHVEKAGAIAGLPPLEIGRLRSRFLDTGFAPLSFTEQLQKSRAEFQEALLDRIDALEGNPGGIAPTGEIGDIMADGTVYGGLSPTTGRKLFVSPRDVRKNQDLFAHFSDLASLRDFHGHDGGDRQLENLLTSLPDHKWRLPTIGELEHLNKYKDRGAFKDNFDENKHSYRSMYWSISKKDKTSVQTLLMQSGNKSWANYDHAGDLSARYVLTLR